MSTVTLYHNPACGTSRSTLALIREQGIEPEIIDYLQTPPSKATLVKLIADMGISVRALIRTNNDLYVQLELANQHWTDDQLIDFILANPLLMNRPIVVTPAGTRLCRPKERVLSLLPHR